MALYTVSTGTALAPQDVNQLVNLLTGLDNTTQVTVGNAIQSVTVGCPAPSRYVGGTTSGAPSSGTFLAGDMVIAQDGFIWVCVTAGTPGTWYRQGSGNYFGRATQAVAQTLTSRSGQSGFDVLNVNTVAAGDDPHGMFSTSNHRFTIPFSGGTWLVNAVVGTTLASTNFSQAPVLTKNGTVFARGSEYVVTNGGDNQVCDIQQFASGDLIQLGMYAEAAAAVNTGAGHVVFSLCLIG
jgi:hypothetical protein